MANPIVKVGIAAAKAAAKAAGKNVKPSLKAARKAKPLAEPKSGVRVKGAAKSRPNKPDAAKINYKENSTRGRAGATAYSNFAKDTTPRKAGSGVDKFMTFNDEAGYEAMVASKEAVLGRKTKIAIQKSMGIKRTKRPKKK